MARNANLFARPPQDNTALNPGAPVKDKYNDVYATGVNRRMADLRYGGQMGYSPDFSTWVNFHPYVSRHVIPILVEPPLGMRFLPNANHWIGALRALIETIPMAITGLNAELTVNTQTVPFGGGGQEFEVYTNVKRAKPDINIQYTERVGMSIFRYWDAYIRYLMMDPDTKNATINTIDGSQLNDLMADQFSMTVLFIEPDELHRFVNQAWLVTNMFPKTSGVNQAKMDKANDNEKRDLTIQFSGIAQYGAGVDDFAQIVMNEINIIGADPHGREAFTNEISGYVKDLVGEGYESSVERINPINRILNPQARTV